jgi:hypothetical protein
MCIPREKDPKPFIWAVAPKVEKCVHLRFEKIASRKKLCNEINFNA